MSTTLWESLGGEKQLAKVVSDLVDAAALAADLKDLREFLRTQYPGYSLLAQAPDFNVDDFFRDWRPQRRFGRSICVATLTGTQ